MTGYDSEKGRPSSVYVLPHWVSGRPTQGFSQNACREILLEHYDALPDEARKDFDTYCLSEDADREALGNWAREFLAASEEDGPWPKRKGGLVASPDDFTTAMKTLYAVWQSGRMGRTANEIKHQLDLRSDGVSGSLSALHMAGVLTRLKEKR